LIHVQHLPEKHIEKPRQAQQCKVNKDKRSGIESDPNRIDDPGYIVRLVAQVITVSAETVKLVNELAQAVKTEDWIGEAVEAKE
jgi:hypothetical protein